MKNTKTLYITIPSTIITIFLIIIALDIFTFSTEIDNKTEQDLFNKKYYITSVKIPNKLSFANEQVPIEKTYVKENLDRELLINTYWQSQTLLFLKKKNRYFNIIEPILKRNNIPDDFKYLAVIESSLMPRIVSPSGAVGIWQLMKPTAIELGLEVNKEVDERYNIEKSTEAACKYLQEAFDIYQSWTLAAASYNAGKNAINKQLKKQKADNYYKLLLGPETSRYIYRIIAIKQIFKNPETYGFHIKKEDIYPNIKVDTIKYDKSISNIADYAIKHNISYKEFKDLNPWLRENTLTNKNNKTYKILIPKKKK